MYDVLRAIHILFGVYLGGVTLFQLFIFNPRLRQLGPSIRSTVIGALTPAMGPAMGAAGIVVLGTGIAMTLMQPNIASLFASVWGWGIIVSTFAMLAFIVNGGAGVVPTAGQIRKLSASISGRPPTTEEAQKLQHLSVKMDRLENLQIVYILVGLMIMVLVRFL